MNGWALPGVNAGAGFWAGGDWAGALSASSRVTSPTFRPGASLAIHEGVARVGAVLMAVGLVLMAGVGAACGRTTLGGEGEIQPDGHAGAEPGSGEDTGGAGGTGGTAGESGVEPLAGAAGQLSTGGASSGSGASGFGGTGSSECVPAEEVCNGVDDDCNGEIDEVEPLACPGGGFRYCVSGAYSACPQRCETCVPGSERICLLSYCLYWGIQTCTSDGRGWSSCREANPPQACSKIAQTKQKSRQLQQCCIDNGYCCVDEFDLDGDGSKKDVLGQCDEVLCN